jgi:hypothetical protein
LLTTPRNTQPTCDILGAIATIIQSLEYGVSFSNKAIAVYNNRGELTDLRKLIREYQQQNADFKTSLHIRAPNPNSPEALLIKIAEECQQTASGLLDILGRLTTARHREEQVHCHKDNLEN